MEGLNFDQILDDSQIDDLFVDNSEDVQNHDDSDNKNNNDTTEVVDTDNLFVKEPESVGSEENHEGGMDAG
jgi:hypothetical protein